LSILKDTRFGLKPDGKPPIIVRTFEATWHLAAESKPAMIEVQEVDESLSVIEISVGNVTIKDAPEGII
jgi:hypothetical protein